MCEHEVYWADREAAMFESPWRVVDDVCFAGYMGFARDTLIGNAVQMIENAVDTCELRSVTLPTSLIADHRDIVGRHWASSTTGKVPTNYHQMLVSLIATQKSSDERREALLVVAPHALEYEYSRPIMAKGCLPTCFGFNTTRDTPWKRVPHNGVVEDDTGGGVEAAQGLSDSIDLDLAHVRGDTQSSTVCTIVGESGSVVRGDADAPGDTGSRDAKSRFPHMTAAPAFLFSNHPQNLISGESQRNVDVGRVEIKPETRAAMKKVTDLLIKHVFTEDKCKSAARKVGRTKDALPTKFTDADRERMEAASLSETGLYFDNKVDAFVKAEVSAKPKPRLIANHGARRITALATVAKIYETVLFSTFKYASIKGRKKKQALSEIARNMAKVRGSNTGVVENDLTAFEFGIGKAHKECEQEIFRAIAAHLNLAAHGVDAAEFERVVDQRNKTIMWRMRYKDQETNERKVVTIVMDKPVRESGDRLTSSGNFLQNLIAWLLILVDWTGDALERAIIGWVKRQGALLIYSSRLVPESNPQYAVLGFEGDDTIAKFGETGVREEAERFMTEDYGWKPKLKSITSTGDGALTFVGYEMLFTDGHPVFVDDEVVCQPELKRCLKTKDFQCTACEENMRAWSNAVYARLMAEEFDGNPPMVTFFNAVRADWLAKATGEICVTDDCRKTLALSKTGTTEGAVPLAVDAFESTLSRHTMRLATVTGGPYTELEFAKACGLTTLEVSGSEAAAFMPAAWLS
jgi:hypothetical protein